MMAKHAILKHATTDKRERNHRRLKRLSGIV